MTLVIDLVRKGQRSPGGSMLKIYGASHSRAFRVIWLANEIGIPYEHVPVTFNVPDAQCKEPWYMHLTPTAVCQQLTTTGSSCGRLMQYMSISRRSTHPHFI